MPLTIIGVFGSLPEAHAARAALDVEGFESEISGGGATSVDPYGPLWTKDVKLLVADEDVSAAREVLRAAGYRGAVEKAAAARPSAPDREWPRNFRVAGLLIAVMAVLLLLTQGEGAGWTLLGFGVLLWILGWAGGLRQQSSDDAANEAS